MSNANAKGGVACAAPRPRTVKTTCQKQQRETCLCLFVFEGMAEDAEVRVGPDEAYGGWWFVGVQLAIVYGPTLI